MLGAGNALLLGRGLELCFGIDRYLMIMLFGCLSGAGVVLMIWLARCWPGASKAKPWRLAASGAIPAVVVFSAYFLWRVLPLIREEIRYYR